MCEFTQNMVTQNSFIYYALLVMPISAPNLVRKNVVLPPSHFERSTVIKMCYFAQVKIHLSSNKFNQVWFLNSQYFNIVLISASTLLAIKKMKIYAWFKTTVFIKGTLSI